ncbi:DUF4384 domain-containing protein [candidate division KSB1 bacterium]|nr:DUF4384 domain-containing protein [candidate division KSB1 bacterium]
MKKPVPLLLALLASLVLQLPVFSQATKTIIVLDFEDQGFRRSDFELAVWLPAQIQKALVASPYITVVERHKLNEVLKEHALSQTGVIDESTAIKVGKLIGAQKILMGEFEYGVNGKYALSARLVDIERGRVEGQWLAADLEQKKIKTFVEEVASGVNAKMKNLLALEKIVRLENPSAPFQITIATTKESFLLDELVTFTLTADRNCYVHLFDIGASGKIHLLFPNKLQPNNFIKAGETIRIENIKASPPAGMETVKAIATLDSVSFGEMIDLVSAPATFQALGEDVEKFSRDLEIVVSPLAKDRWTAARLAFEIEEK